jgi:hypothetical protein
MISKSTPTYSEEFLADYRRGMMRSAFVSLFWNVISYKKENGGFSLKWLADKLGIHKSLPTRWFSADRPNWTANTIADIAGALDIDIEIRARDRSTGILFAPHGIVQTSVMSAQPQTESEPGRRPINQPQNSTAEPSSRVRMDVAA